jgi:hypothetical protein
MDRITMQRFIQTTRGLSSPAILMVVVWCALLIGVAFGPIDYGSQPSGSVLAIVGCGIGLFIVAHYAGAWCFDSWLRSRPNVPAPTIRTLNVAVSATSLLGLFGIGLIALDRLVLSGVSNGGYAELLRCAPSLVDIIEIKRTPLLYLGYLTFSFGFVSLVLFILKGEEIRGWPAILGQLSIISPVVYAVLYSGRMPILFVIVLIGTAALSRIRQGRTAFPRGHHLLVKLVLVFVLFGIYSSAMWASRQNFCAEMSGLIRELQQKQAQRDLEKVAELQLAQAKPKQQPSLDKGPAAPAMSAAPAVEEKAQVREPPSPGTQAEVPKSDSAAGQPPTPNPPPVETVRAADVSKMIGEAKPSSSSSATQKPPGGISALLKTMEVSWHVGLRGYALSSIESGRIPSATATALVSTYFYLTHGVRILDLTWNARQQISPQWGVYEVGVISPIIRVFFPQSSLLDVTATQLKAADIYGFFPSAWAAAYIDFGIAGAMIYILVWGFAAGWSNSGTRHSALTLPPLLLTFVLASILLSPVQGPLGIANSAMVLCSLVIAGLAIDLGVLASSARKTPEINVRASA